MQSNIFRRLVSMDPTLVSNENQSEQTIVDRILLDLSSIPADLSTGKIK